MLINNTDISQTASSGAWSFNTKSIVNGLLKQVIVEAATPATTTFNFTITDKDGLTIFATEMKATGKLRQEMEVPMKGIHTLAVSGSNADELFKGKILIQEL